MTLPPLTPRQTALAAEIALDDTNIAKAGKKAGFRSNQDIYETARKPHVQARIEENKTLLARKSVVTKEEVEAALVAIAFSDVRKFMKLDPLTGETLLDWENMTPEEAATLSEVSITQSGGVSKVLTSKIKTPDKLAALLALAKIKGLMKDQLELSGTVSLEKLIERSFQVIDQPNPPLLEEIVIEPDDNGSLPE